MNAMKWHRGKADGGKCVLHQLHGFRFRVAAKEFRQKLKKNSWKKWHRCSNFVDRKFFFLFLLWFESRIRSFVGDHRLVHNFIAFTLKYNWPVHCSWLKTSLIVYWQVQEPCDHEEFLCSLNKEQVQAEKETIIEKGGNSFLLARPEGKKGTIAWKGSKLKSRQGAWNLAVRLILKSNFGKTLMWLVPGQLANRHGNISFGNPMLRVKSKYDDQTKKKAWVVSGLMEKDQL